MSQYEIRMDIADIPNKTAGGTIEAQFITAGGESDWYKVSDNFKAGDHPESTIEVPESLGEFQGIRLRASSPDGLTLQRMVIEGPRDKAYVLLPVTDKGVKSAALAVTARKELGEWLSRSEIPILQIKVFFAGIDFLLGKKSAAEILLMLARGY
ncbi:hypothetical protein MOV08_25450 [Streptomyces yunnanensis]|uniref:Polyketide cyclase / dehydrase and lipid transport n=1 Tax=Streptomyces yunnanensis TaxID=156453 RepID=A0ABY8ABA7_9ACTN|nr:hypothetical protein [Streptomyces yunnanensis]WEB42260.1 hypothetical protein MOV08_25450 [Streptomyces yunnanensis]